MAPGWTLFARGYIGLRASQGAQRKDDSVGSGLPSRRNAEPAHGSEQRSGRVSAANRDALGRLRPSVQLLAADTTHGTLGGDKIGFTDAMTLFLVQHNGL